MADRMIVDGAALQELLAACVASADPAVHAAVLHLMNSGVGPAPNADRWMTRRAAARTYGISERTVDRMIERGQWRARRVGRKVLVDTSRQESSGVDSNLDSRTPPRHARSA